MSAQDERPESRGLLNEKYWELACSLIFTARHGDREVFSSRQPTAAQGVQAMRVYLEHMIFSAIWDALGRKSTDADILELATQLDPPYRSRVPESSADLITRLRYLVRLIPSEEALPLSIYADAVILALLIDSPARLIGLRKDLAEFVKIPTAVQALTMEL